jgi:dihydrodipicolinate synthase/N-acetylneuraminate lyase
MDRHIEALKVLHEGTYIPATPLALNAGRQLDERRLRCLMRYYLNAGVGGIATAVHTTQFAIRDPKYNMYEPVLRIVSDEISQFETSRNKAIVKVAGVCGEIEQVLKEAELAKACGYDAALLSPSGLQHLSEDAMIERTEAVAKIMPVIGFYLQPSAGGRLFTYSYWERLVQVPNVVAIKAAPFNRFQALDVVRAVSLSGRKDEIALYTGNDDNIIADLLATYKFGGIENHFVGGLLGQWSVWAKTSVEIYHQARRRENIPELLTLATQLTDANAAIFDAAHGFKGCIPGIEEVLRRQGILEGTWCLDPAEVLSPGQTDEIDRVYRMYPHLNDDAFVKAHVADWLK